MLAADTRPRMFGEEALWYQKRGAARVALNRLEEAELDVRRASSRRGAAMGAGAGVRGARKDCRPAA